MNRWFIALDFAKMNAIFKRCASSYGNIKLPLQLCSNVEMEYELGHSSGKNLKQGGKSQEFEIDNKVRQAE
jgi:hypothetical protein